VSSILHTYLLPGNPRHNKKLTLNNEHHNDTEKSFVCSRKVTGMPALPSVLNTKQLPKGNIRRRHYTMPCGSPIMFTN